MSCGPVIRVWAPRADQVALDAPGGRVAMSRETGGWWSAPASHLPHGTDYAFYVDDEGPFPDPRSPWQPKGIDGPSRRLDHDRFEWTDAGWQPSPLSAAIVYELHVGTFTPEGTFAAVIDRLDYLREIGVTHLELMPVAEFSGRHGWGYDGVDLFAPHHAYGTPADLKRLVNACHAWGLAVLLDVVYNHLGPRGNYLGRFGPYFTDRHHTPWGDAVNFDGPDSDEVRRFVVDNACMWLRDYHVDGLRLDAVHAIVDTSAVHILEQLARRVRALEAQVGRRLTVVAESDLNNPRLIRAPEAGGYGLDAQWVDDVHHAIHTAVTDEHEGYYADYRGLADLAAALRRGYVYEGQYAPSRRRAHGRPACIDDGARCVVCMQNHDQVGNRAAGDRIHHAAGMARARVGAALVLTSPFVPLLFQGEEWGAGTPFQYFTAHEDPALADAVRKGRRGEFGAFGWRPEDVPDPQDLATYERSCLLWEEAARDVHAHMLGWYKALIRIRRREPDLRDGQLRNMEVFGDPQGGSLGVRRGAVTTVCCLAKEPCRVPLPDGIEHIAWLLRSGKDVRVENGQAVLPPDSVGVLKGLSEPSDELEEVW